MQMAKIRQLDDVEGQIPGHVIVIKVKNLQILELRELRRKRAIDDIVGQVEKPQPRNHRDLGRDGTGELVGGDGEVGQEQEVSEFRRKSTGEVKPREVEGGHVTTGVARDAAPCAVAGGGVPGG
ncbi:hypothetical protein TorRG33x02_071910 [Trema orientale]|uniref:Uncharacterized protein n=1 Tax=Trema orientale TaxID=63057 RepID=A0A2P5FH76_TREOI|nr:hypothetical protein TorRG33x02_071910 [Trema orientale]